MRVRKRILLPILLLAALLLASGIAWTRSRTSTVVIYNETGAQSPPFIIGVCGQTKLFDPIPEESSVRFRILSTGGSGTPIRVEFLSNPPWQWVGGFVEPNAGNRVTLRVWPNQQVEIHHQVSFWQQLFGEGPSVSE